MSCKTCGHEREGDIQPHNFGCAESLAARTFRIKRREDARPIEEVVTEELAKLAQCAKDGCTEPRAVSKGPRPAKYCDEHKIVRSK